MKKKRFKKHPEINETSIKKRARTSDEQNMKTRNRNVTDMEQKRFKQNDKETLTTFWQHYIYMYIYIFDFTYFRETTSPFKSVNKFCQI